MKRIIAAALGSSGPGAPTGYNDPAKLEAGLKRVYAQRDPGYQLANVTCVAESPRLFTCNADVLTFQGMPWGSITARIRVPADGTNWVVESASS